MFVAWKAQTNLETFAHADLCHYFLELTAFLKGS